MATSEPNGFDLQERLIELSVRVSQICESLPPTRVGKHVAGQLVRCGTAPAALHAEAQAAESRKDFIHKLGLCLKELRETIYWLRYLSRLNMGDGTAVNESVAETDQVIAIDMRALKYGATGSGAMIGSPIY